MNAIDLQLPDTAIAVGGSADWCPPGSRRRGVPPLIFATNASVTPLVSPPPMLLASERKPTQVGGVSWKAPSIVAAKEAPLARARLPVREIRTVRPIRHGTPSLSILPVRLTTNTSLTPFVSPLTRFDASDWKAIARA